MNFTGGKITNFRGVKRYPYAEKEVIEFKIDKNLSVWDVNPRKISKGGLVLDVLSTVRGQVPDVAYRSFLAAYDKLLSDVERYGLLT